ncbi:hypothetical protein MMC08_002764 [Hypocenomyce scalaris]|nr:hypothetical protein [Hypocenomyce scalaris]
MDGEMDIDMDIDLGPVTDMEVFQPVRFLAALYQLVDGNTHLRLEQVKYQQDLTSIANQPTNNTSLQPSDGDLQQAAPHKIHIRGVDDLTTEDIKAFSAAHFPSELPTRIEWIDDTSANIVFNTPANALAALAQFSLSPVDGFESIPKLQLRRAKELSTHPHSKLHVRIALFTDQKRPRAYETSRFYLMHPEHDPRERRRRDRSSHDGHGDYRRRRYGHEEHRRRRDDDNDRGYVASMYDDDQSALADRGNGNPERRGSRSTLSSEEERGSSRDPYHRSRRSRGISIRSARHGASNGRLRDRSASPDQVSEEEDYSNPRRLRRRTPPPRYQSRDPHPFPRQNDGKELFPLKSTVQRDISAELRGIRSSGHPRELFPNKQVAANLKKELFPSKANTINHRRSDAFDAADETADLFATGMPVPFTDGAMDPQSSLGKLADRITHGTSSNFGRLKGTDTEPDPDTLEHLESGGFSIRGAAKQQDRGFSIRGIAGEGVTGGPVKELFPGKTAGNAGKELFTEKLRGRGGRRNRAEDMFY